MTQKLIDVGFTGSNKGLVHVSIQGASPCGRRIWKDVSSVIIDDTMSFGFGFHRNLSPMVCTICYKYLLNHFDKLTTYYPETRHYK